MLENLANKITAVTAVLSLVIVGVIYQTDFTYIGKNIAVRNIAWAQKEICESFSDDEQMWEYLMEELNRYKRYNNTSHRYEGMSEQELCE
jgi:hypothetical protein